MDSGLLGSIFKRTWSISDLLKIDETRQAKALSCVVALVDTFHKVKKETLLGKFRRFFSKNRTQVTIYHVVFKFSVVSDTGSMNYVYIETQPDFNCTEFLSNKVQVYCTCKDFMYRSAWILNQHNSLYRSSNTDSLLGPAITNAPKGKAKSSVLCKHAYAAVMNLANNYSTLMRGL